MKIFKNYNWIFFLQNFILLIKNEVKWIRKRFLSKWKLLQSSIRNIEKKIKNEKFSVVNFQNKNFKNVLKNDQKWLFFDKFYFDKNRSKIV